METREYINTMRSKSRSAESVAARQTMCYFLRNNNVPFLKIASVLKINMRMAYNYYYRARDLAETNDSLITRFMQEINNHKVSIRPVMVDGDIQAQVVGYLLLIDDIIY